MRESATCVFFTDHDMAVVQCFAEGWRMQWRSQYRSPHLCATSGIFPQASVHQTIFAAA